MAYIDISHPNPLLKIRFANRSFCTPDWIWNSSNQMHWNGFNLWYVSRGTGRLLINNKEHILSPGDCFLLRMWEHHIGTNPSLQTIVIPWVVFNYYDAKDKSLTPGKINALPERYRRMSDPSFFDKLMQRIIDASHAGQEDDTCFWLQTALREIHQEDEQQRKRLLPLEQKQAFQELCSAIRENPGERYDISELAAKTGYSIDHFIRLFRKIQGLTPMDYIIQARIQAASHLLLFSADTITAISEKIGYKDPFSFSRQFRAKTGLSPAHYRIKHLSKS